MEYLSIIIILPVSFLFASLLYGVSYFLINKKYDIEKIASYECGFEAFDNSRNKFEVHFYLVSILFIIFDLEIMFLFPWCVSLRRTGISGYVRIIIFLFILTVGFLYEWASGALNWA